MRFLSSIAAVVLMAWARTSAAADDDDHADAGNLEPRPADAREAAPEAAPASEEPATNTPPPPSLQGDDPLLAPSVPEPPAAARVPVERDSDPAGDVNHDLAPSVAFQQVRYLEDYSRLASADLRAPLDVIKYIPLWPGGYLSLGGQHRLRYEYMAPSELGKSVSESMDSVLFSRNLLHTDFHFTPYLRLFAQAGAYYAFGSPAEDAPPGADVFDVAQLFLETRFQVAGVNVTTRLGRQEMGLGSTRWVSIRDGTNVRQAFDIGRVVLTGRNWNSHTFFGVVPKLQRGALDDEPNTKNLFWGSYWTLNALPRKALSFDVFYLGRSRPAVYRELSGREVRHTMGVRVFGELDTGLEYIAHGLIQVGKLGDADVLAWGTAGALRQRLPGFLHPVRIGVRGDALSGDAKAGDGKVGTFDPLFPNQTFFSALSLISPANLYDVHPLVSVDLAPVVLEAGWIFYYRQQTADAVYAPGAPPLIKAALSDARFTGSQPSLSLGYSVTRNLTFNIEYSHVFAGAAMREAGGRDIDFLGQWTTFTY
ncbi:Hypothetical protein AKJ09_05381 [Labilithrix luteola]|uniref:Alginate export domain-containing protein n=1 Tax=Labilithrix luteola TaxID=1391654 RepID=A0A0K1PZ08_9BACT|nr:alginate export family protein [Labilithrix luteola]AKU98717.1 Hypothetical protein AKJ09_05381 [Labilithrix luteola]